MIQKDTISNIEVYWSSLFDSTGWNDFDNIYNLYDELFKNINKNDIEPRQNLLMCPSVSKKLKNTFFVKTPIDCEYEIKDGKIKPVTDKHIDVETPHLPSLKNNFLFVLGMFYIFFSKESVKMNLTSPFFSKCDYTQYAHIVPGNLDISKWFRMINLEFNCYDNKIKFTKGEPLAYFTFDTDKQVKLKRFKMTQKLHTLSATCFTSSNWEKWVPLYNRYKRFLKSRTDKIVLREIQKNLL
jgi:hypothetical protein